ncbi:hypothetical protein [Paraburkholderia caffeinilytica]|uniref:hypothetical protein n=1 Tax=Paraburkholderia caffeinilytica TaxID=1761016 RepID=UPI003DA00659
MFPTKRPHILSKSISLLQAAPTFGTATTTPAINLLRIEETLSAAHLRLTGAHIEHLPSHEVRASL